MQKNRNQTPGGSTGLFVDGAKGGRDPPDLRERLPDLGLIRPRSISFPSSAGCADLDPPCLELARPPSAKPQSGLRSAFSSEGVPLGVALAALRDRDGGFE